MMMEDCEVCVLMTLCKICELYNASRHTWATTGHLDNGFTKRSHTDPLPLLSWEWPTQIHRNIYSTWAYRKWISQGFFFKNNGNLATSFGALPVCNEPSPVPAGVPVSSSLTLGDGKFKSQRHCMAPSRCLSYLCGVTGLCVWAALTEIFPLELVVGEAEAASSLPESQG